MEDFLKLLLVEEFARNEAVLFLEKPAEDQPGEQADQARGAAFLGVLFEVVGEIDLIERPEIPVRKLLVEAVVEQLDVEDLLPCGVEGIEVPDREFLRVLQLCKGDGLKDLKVPAMRRDERDVANEGHLLQHILVRVDFVLAAVDDSDGEAAVVLEQDHYGHREDAVDLTRDGRELAARVFAALQLDGKKQVGAKQAALDVGFLEEG